MARLAFHGSRSRVSSHAATREASAEPLVVRAQAGGVNGNRDCGLLRAADAFHLTCESSLLNYALMLKLLL